MNIFNMIKRKSDSEDNAVKQRNKKMRHRIISVVVSAAIMTNSLPLAGMSEYLGISGLLGITEPMTASAYDPKRNSFDGHVFIFNELSDFVDFCYYYQLEETFADEHEEDSIVVSITDPDPNARKITEDYEFAGLGTELHPFAGSLTFGSSEYYSLSAHSAIFDYLSDSAAVGDLKLTRLSEVGADESKPLLANHVMEGSGSGTWSIEAVSEYSFSGVIGEIETGAHVNLTFKNSTGQNVVFNGNDLNDAGAICGKMGDNSSLSISYTGDIDYAVTSAHGNAGGLVGTMGSGASITVSTAPTSYTPAVTANGYAGGLVGDMASSATITNRPSTIGGSVNGGAGAGGLYGHYGFTVAKAIDLEAADYQTTATVGGNGFCGGLYGVLETTEDLTLTGTRAFTGSNGGYFGGVIGKLETALAKTVSLTNLELTPTANGNFNVFGGVFGKIDTAAYVSVNNVSVTASGSGVSGSVAFGGVIGETADANGVFVDLGNFTLKANNYKGGGIVGKFHNGVLRLHDTTDMSDGKPASADNSGQLVGFNNNVLVYALGDGTYSNWTFNRSNGASADDLGTWGEVVRNIDDSSVSNMIYFNNHTVTLAGVTADSTGGDYKIGTAADFVAVALNMQLNNGTGYECLLFDSGSSRSTLLGSKLTLTDDISLAGTGINGFMRDGGSVDGIGAFTGTLDGTQNDENNPTYTITLAVGETYGMVKSGNDYVGVSTLTTNVPEGAGQVYRHQHNGLFSVLAGTVSNLTVDGAITVHNCVDGMNIGGIASRNGGNIVISNVTVKETVNYYEQTSVTGTEAAGKNIGGFIGFVGANGTITISGECVVGKGDATNADLILTGKHKSWNTYGGAIGKVTADSFTFNVGTIFDSTQAISESNPLNKLTMKMVTDISGLNDVSNNSDCGGLIGHITKAGSYSSRIVNINNLEYNGCTIGNAATTNGGGLLGYSWLNATANIKGMTVTSATVNNRTISNSAVTAGGNTNVGAMCYVATGKWAVDKLDVASLTINSGCSESLGMLVNKAYTGTANSDGSTTYTGGLYLDVLNSGYTFTTVSPPSSLKKFDEIAAYTARTESDVLTGNAGVISINMNSGGRRTETTTGEGDEAVTTVTNDDTKITDTGTYQNKLTSVGSSQYQKFANPTSRYYYNLDNMDSTDAAQNLLLWSVKKYAYTDIQDEFSTSFDSTINGTADMSGLSFYPVPKADGVTIGTLTLTLDYDEIYTTAEAVFGTANPTDNYNRDPGAYSVAVNNKETNAKNQHFLMHSGLFLNSTAGTTLTISGALTLKGNFLEVGNYKGVLISDTMRGALTCTAGSIVLDGITPKTTERAAYINGYLLINNIKRKDEQTAIPVLNLHNVKTTTGYNTDGVTAQVAKSLIGPASGPGLQIEFSHIRLDSRETAGLSGTTDLNIAYCTYRSIFTQSTLINSIRTDQNGQLVYNYTFAEDWEATGDEVRFVTYGWEISGSVEHSNQEKKYKSALTDPKNRFYTNPESQPSSASTEYTAFSSNYLRYVYNNNETFTGTQGDDGLYYRELSVNVEAEGLVYGCGTYNDPYLISTKEQLQSVAKYLRDGDPDDLGKIKLPKTNPSSYTSGARWCTVTNGVHDDAEYEYDPTTSVQKFTSTATTAKWTKANVQEYLANAYYKITTNITLDDNFVGLGGITANTAFRGVIVGSGTNDGVPTVTITNSSVNPLIKVSNGCVIKDINVTVKKAEIQIQQEQNTYDKAYFTYGYLLANGNVNDSACKFYGGLIGEVMGGDNIIDNSYVSYQYQDENNATQNTIIKLTGTDGKGTIVPVGGYVGVIVFGGVIFKNMTVTDTITNTETDTNPTTGEEEEVTTTTQVLRVNNSHINVQYTNKGKNLADNVGDEDWAAIYANPIVGRVINGYAVNETEDIYETAAQAASNGHATPQVVTPGRFTISEDGNYHDDDNKTERLSLPENDTAKENLIAKVDAYQADNTRPKPTDAEMEQYNNLSKLHSLKNGTKHYSIADINLSETKKLDVSGVPTSSSADGTINIPNAQAFFVLSLITQSCAGTAQSAKGDYKTSLSYGTYSSSVYGMSHVADYSHVGSATSTSDADYVLASKDTAGNTATSNYAIPYIIYHYTEDTNGDKTGSFNARCVTSTLGYYDINLTGKTAYGTVTPSETEGGEDTVTPLDEYTYQLPDSFRGLGSVGFYDYETTVLNNKYSMKVDIFTGNDCTIDQDIYLNKFQTDNYFDTLHKGINQVLSDADNNNIPYLGNTVNSGTYRVPQTNGLGLFNSIILKTKVTEFTLTGSVNTEIYSNTYAASNQEQNFVNGTADNSKILWLSSGGVCGWIRDGVYGEFSYIDLDDLVVSGADFVGGIIGFSGLSSTSNYFTIKQCNANNVSVEMTSARNIETTDKARNAIGCFVGKIQEGAVHIYGTSSLDENSNDYSTVKIKSFKFANPSLDYYTAAGGLVGFAGNGCKIYNMKVMPSDGYNVTIGDDKIKFVGGMVGAMQSKDRGGTTGVAIFKNCTVERININGNFAGGFYGGKWDSEWTTYSLTFENCKMIGSSTSHNTIVGNNMSNDKNGYAGGFIGRLYPYTNIEKVNNKDTVTHNVLIKDCKISNYDITAKNKKQSYVGGFIGYASSAKNSVTCYLHDSSIESCTIGASGNYAGGVIGQITQKNANQLLGYNIKLDNIQTNSGDKMGAWIGSAPSDTATQTTSIQFTGMAVYGNGITKNVGNNATLGKASFVFADYTGQSYGETTTGTDPSITGTASYHLNQSDKTITRTVKKNVAVYNNGERQTEKKMQTWLYSYVSEPTPTESATEDADGDTWTLDLSADTITHVHNESGKAFTYVYEVTLQNNVLYSLNETTKTIKRSIISGSGSSASVHTITYNYTDAPIESSSTDIDSWSIDETNGKLTRIENGTKYVYTIAVSGFNEQTTYETDPETHATKNLTNVEMPKYPFVNINPQSKLGASEIISGDGAVLYGSNVADADYSYTENGATKYYPSAKTMAAKILSDIKDTGNRRRYTTFDNEHSSIQTNSGNVPFLTYMQRGVNDDGCRISTFATERQGIVLPNGVNDFAVVVIATNDAIETTNLLNRYIQLVTNTEGDKNYAANNEYYHVDIKTCTYSDGSFTINSAQSAETAGLIHDKDNGQFVPNRDYADSKNTNTFTLVDIQFLDPFNKDYIAYHLYIPVYTIKEMAINFYAVAKTGAHPSSSTNNYADLMSANCNHVDSLNTWMTHYIRYEYRPDDIETLLNSGKLKWNYQKHLDFQTFTGATEDQRLPGETYMALVDPNGNADQIYYANVSDMTSYTPDAKDGEETRISWRVPLSAFKDDSENAFKVASFNKIVAKDLEAVSPAQVDQGKYNLVAELTAAEFKTYAGAYDVYVITNDTEKPYKCYRFCVDGNGTYDLRVKRNVTAIYEDYYISIYVRDVNYDHQLYHYSVITPPRFFADNDNIESYVSGSLNVRSASVTQPHNCTILIADLFKQDLTGRMEVLPALQQIRANNRTITVKLSSLIEPNIEAGLTYMNSDEFFHSFYITLVRESKNGIESDIKALKASNISTRYKIDSPLTDNDTTPCTDVDLSLRDNYLNVQTFPSTNSSTLISRLVTGEKKFEIYAEIEMTFDEEELAEEFPENVVGQSYGVNVQAASNLAYDTNTLSHTSMTQKYAPDPHKYYIESVKSASLQYSSRENDIDWYDEIGWKSSNRSTLGVNGKSTNDADRTNKLNASGIMPVNTEAFYNVLSLTMNGNPKKLKITFALKKKSNTKVEYTRITSMQNYLDGKITFTSDDAYAECDATGETGTAILDVEDCNYSGGMFDIVISFNAKSGNDFHEYANYEVDLTAELYYDDNCQNNVDNSVATDYLIYTNAKINHELLSKPAANP